MAFEMDGATLIDAASSIDATLIDATLIDATLIDAVPLAQAAHATEVGDWLARFHAGDRKAIEECYRDCFVIIDRTIARMLSGMDKENAVHEVFFRLLTSDRMRASFRGGSVGAWLSTIAHHQAIDYIRRHRIERAASVKLGHGTQHVDAERRSEARLLVNRFRNEVLPKKWAAVFDLRFLQQVPQSEAAQQLGISRTTLRYQEHRVRSLLRKFLLRMMQARCDEVRLIDRHFAGSIMAAAERQLRAHLPGCTACRRVYEQHLVLAELDPKATPAQERMALGLGSSARGPARRFSPLLVASAVVMALAGILFLPRTVESTAAPSARGPVTAAVGAGGELFTYRLRQVGAAERVAVAGELATSDELAFAYRNPKGYQRLLVFAVDEHKHIYWFYPAWQDGSQRPVAVRIEKSDALKELPDAIKHGYDGTRLDLHAIFTDQALSVGEIEQRIAAGAPAAENLPLPGTEQATFRLSLTR